MECFVLAILTNLTDSLQSDNEQACKDDGDALIKRGPVVIKDTDKQRSTACHEQDANHLILALLKDYSSPGFQLWELLGVYSETIVSEFQALNYNYTLWRRMISCLSPTMPVYKID